MEFEWDEAKRLSNIEKHGIDFFRARSIFDGRPRTELISSRGDEKRFVSTADLDDRIVTVVWIKRRKVIRLISVRGARDAEKRQYRSLLQR